MHLCLLVVVPLVYRYVVVTASSLFHGLFQGAGGSVVGVAGVHCQGRCLVWLSSCAGGLVDSVLLYWAVRHHGLSGRGIHLMEVGFVVGQ
jgi:hypothetical protein